MEQQPLFESDSVDEQSLLTTLLQHSKLYSTSQSYKELLDFVNRLPHIAPFNALLLSIQKPGLRFAASEFDWRNRFNRNIKEGARPLVILWPFAPVTFVFDLEDTEGEELPEAVTHAFRANGSIIFTSITKFVSRLAKKGISLTFLDYGDGLAGNIIANSFTVERRSANKDKLPDYRIRLNVRHYPNVQFATLVHELAHLFLGHLGPDGFLKIPDRSFLAHAERELEAESLGYLVSHRAGVISESESYLAPHLDESFTVDRLDVFTLMRAAGQVETILGLATHFRNR